MTRYSQLWVDEQRKVSKLEKLMEQRDFELALMRGFIQDGNQDAFAQWIADKMLRTTPTTDSGSVT